MFDTMGKLPENLMNILKDSKRAAKVENQPKDKMEHCIYESTTSRPEGPRAALVLNRVWSGMRSLRAGVAAVDNREHGECFTSHSPSFRSVGSGATPYMDYRAPSTLVHRLGSTGLRGENRGEGKSHMLQSGPAVSRTKNKRLRQRPSASSSPRETHKPPAVTDRVLEVLKVLRVSSKASGQMTAGNEGEKVGEERERRSRSTKHAIACDLDAIDDPR
ncbi:hypothetical protein DFH07DRAFT_939036 [Mycena maculata]|uniref:Uncharacterized protein n=1 Tax=Mycena maculata TaxID=230809 RepID=A0AAD7JGR4_9AGAR|nr:hypothetical protein DFH07DRAFT_939036 [Mycena maculata]